MSGADTCGERPRQDRQSGWWFQLMQSSQVYIDQSSQGSKFTKAERRRRSSERQAPPTREGVVEGAESDRGTMVPKGRLSWMGSPPECVLSQDRRASVEEPGLRWGRLFGSTMSSSQEGSDARRKAQSRAPSGWLRLDSSVFSRVAQSISAGTEIKQQNQSTAPTDPRTAPCHSSTAAARASPHVVRALCHHEAVEPGHLSFQRGDVLTVLRRSDPDTLLCSRGSAHGLVPIVYVTLGETEDSLCRGGTVREALTEDHSEHDI